MNKTAVLLAATAFAFVGTHAIAQGTADPKQAKKDQAAAVQKQMQQESKSSASGQVPVDPNIKSGPAPKGVAQEQALQKASKSSASGSAPVDKSAKPADPREKSAKQMTKEEQQKLLEQAQKASKP